jgi:hypothetical protein
VVTAALPGDHEVAQAGRDPHARWLVAALIRARKDAQIEAELAYEAWEAISSPVRLSAYRDAQGRAEALAHDLEDLVTACAPADVPEALKPPDSPGTGGTFRDTLVRWLTTAMRSYGETFVDLPTDPTMF